MVKIDNIQIRLKTVIDGATFTSSWYGPSDQLRFATLVKSNKKLEPAEAVQLERKAVKVFAKKILQLTEQLNEQ